MNQRQYRVNTSLMTEAGMVYQVPWPRHYCRAEKSNSFPRIRGHKGRVEVGRERRGAHPGRV